MVLRVQLLLQLVNRLRKDQKHQKILSQHEKTFKPKAYSTAADVARMSIYAMRRNAFSFIVRQPERQIGVAGATAKRSYHIRNSNELIGEPGILGVKTGTTAAAGPCVAVCMERDPLVRQKPDSSKGSTPRRLVVVVLNNPERFNRARELIHQGWAVYDPWLAEGRSRAKPAP